MFKPEQLQMTVFLGSIRMLFAYYFKSSEKKINVYIKSRFLAHVSFRTSLSRYMNILRYISVVLQNLLIVLSSFDFDKCLFLSYESRIICL